MLGISNFVEFKPVPYIHQTKDRLTRLMYRNAGYFYAQFNLLMKDPKLRDEIFQIGREKYYDNPKYNQLRDELNEFAS